MPTESWHTKRRGWERGDAPLAFIASNMHTEPSIIRGIIESVISTSEDRAYALLPITWERAEPSERESSSGIVVSISNIEERTIERKATADAALSTASWSDAYDAAHMIAASTMKNALSFRYCLQGRCIADAATIGRSASTNTTLDDADETMTEYERSAISFAAGLKCTRKLSSSL